MDFHVNNTFKIAFIATFRLVFVQTTGHHSATRLTCKISHPKGTCMDTPVSFDIASWRKQRSSEVMVHGYENGAGLQ
jgi:hypothetical protein